MTATPPNATCGRCGQPATDVAGYYLGDPICADCDEQQGWPAACETVPPPPGDADESRVASLRANWTAIVPRGPVAHQTGWQRARPDVLYLLDLAEECLRLRRKQVVLCGRCGLPAAVVSGYYLGDPICRDCDGQQGWPLALPLAAFERAVLAARDTLDGGMMRSIAPLDPRTLTVAVPSDDDLAREDEARAILAHVTRLVDCEWQDDVPLARLYTLRQALGLTTDYPIDEEMWEADIARNRALLDAALAYGAAHAAHAAYRPGTFDRLNAAYVVASGRAVAALDALHAAYAAHAGAGGHR